MYNRKEFGRDLVQEIEKDFDVNHLSSWAHEKYLDHANKLDKETYDAIMTVVFLTEEGFEMTKEDLLKLAVDWQRDL